MPDITYWAIDVGPTFPLLDVLLRFTYCIVGAASRSEAVAVLTEGHVVDRLQNLQYALLDEPVQNGRDAELSLPAAWFVDQLPKDRRRLVASTE